MNQRLLNSLTEVERGLVAETERDALKTLDEDELLELHQRIRRARTKYVKNYRRGASGSVAEHGGRGHAYAKNQRDRDKAELFETSLARVSREVAAAANRAASELRSERLAAARSAASGAVPAAAMATEADGSASNPSTRRKTTKTTGGLKKDASTRATGARRQAKRDARREAATS
ncbi:hypothetical protein FB561_5923 [Kribbella amoyensis]|uniref:Uncharacterized protein n=1 Tax=Kribbella amoyensis TaxID=996641 RepID=A0A561C0L1_9ACTN|nr:hypothetical protein [Kribbella amoyensis]TWD84729.1 hypothetical protein FB561_5923 [Kribbella amoyensis]